MPMSKKLKGTPDRVWLAGLGALAVAAQEGNDLFQQLVQKGREVEKTLEKAGSPRATRMLDKTIGAFYLGNSEGKKKLKDSPLYGFLPSDKEKKEIEARQARRLAAARRSFLKEFGSFDK